MAGNIEPDLGDTNEEVFERDQNMKENRPALTIVIQSWVTPIAALVMLIVGLVGGFFLRPVILPERLLTTQVVDSGQPAATAGAIPDAGEVMEVVSQQTRHYLGDEEAPVTMIEFSDFQ